VRHGLGRSDRAAARPPPFDGFLVDRARASFDSFPDALAGGECLAHRLAAGNAPIFNIQA
jgi:hypothetical protein